MLLCYMSSKLIHLISHVRPFYKDNLQEKKSERKLKEHTNCKKIKNSWGKELNEIQFIALNTEY